jgi:hypothetical protein
VTTKTTHNKFALVDVDHHWIEIEGNPPPAGTKLLLINRKLGVATIGNFTKGCGWTHYAGLPTFKDRI